MNSLVNVNSNLILRKYILDSRLDYLKLRDNTEFAKSLKNFENTDLLSLNNNEQKAFWLNAYNLLTIKSILKVLDKNPEWQGNLSLLAKFKFFIIRRHKIAGKNISLYHLENKIIRRKFKDPRIHFALNCGSMSCPVLPGKLFEAETLEEYLEELTTSFINNQRNVIVNENEISLNRIFKWYKGDFKNAGGIVNFIKKYWKGESISQMVKISYMDYNWHLNIVNLNYDTMELGNI